VARETLLLVETMDGLEALAKPGWAEPTSTSSEGWLELARLCLDLEEQAIATRMLITSENSSRRLPGWGVLKIRPILKSVNGNAEALPACATVNGQGHQRLLQSHRSLPV